MLSDFFFTCFNKTLPPLSSHNIPTPNSDCTIPEDLLCTEDEIYSLLSSLGISKATGPDGISTKTFKSTASSITPFVTSLLNLSLRSGRIPMEWKKSFVKPIPKTSSATSPNNYRPISLLSILNKRHIYTIIILSAIIHLLTLSGDFSLGNQLYISTLLTTTHSWFRILESCGEIGAVFFDLRKTFDSVPLVRLMQKLQQAGLS